MTYFCVTYQHVDREVYLFDTQPVIFPDFNDGRSVLVDSDLISAKISFGRELVPQLPTYNLLKDWIEDCRTNHEQSCGATSNTSKRPKRLIDCQKRRLCLDVDKPYVCLSYVWGAPTNHQCVSNSSLPDELPSTVSDAMDVTLRAGFRYLWVDRYCIDQDDPEEKHNAIRDMDIICKRDPYYRQNLTSQPSHTNIHRSLILLDTVTALKRSHGIGHG